MIVSVIEGIDVLLSFGEGNFALMPSNEEERAQVFEALMGALAVLSRVRLPTSSDAKSTETDAHSIEIEQYPCVHKAGAVVRLSERRAHLSQKSKLAPVGHVPKDY
jgi:hypothetical protein